MPDRMPCLVPFCRCTRPSAASDTASTGWICAEHWRAVPRAVKRARTVAARDLAYPHIAATFGIAWGNRKATAIEAAGRIG